MIAGEEKKDDFGGSTISKFIKILKKFPGDLPIDLWIRAPDFSNIEIVAIIKTMGRTTESDFALDEDGSIGGIKTDDSDGVSWEIVNENGEKKLVRKTSED